MSRHDRKAYQLSIYYKHWYNYGPKRLELCGKIINIQYFYVLVKKDEAGLVIDKTPRLRAAWLLTKRLRVQSLAVLLEVRPESEYKKEIMSVGRVITSCGQGVFVKDFWFTMLRELVRITRIIEGQGTARARRF
ncbi:hypothetical protein RRG08_054470 [Elysia crispata]|uniref:Uncharacterized protein n=1 Tax=Elysia crispata TaxID=231223 RepID=A0AAE0Y746_9GAST|nr:hypothetical protein RRG08_054470 [Elysia crispata]